MQDGEQQINHDSAVELAHGGESAMSKTLLSSSRQRQMNSEQEGSVAVDGKGGGEVDMLADLKLKGTMNTQGGGGTMNQTDGSGAGNTLKRKSKPAYLQSLNESEKQANFKIIEKMNKKISFLKNPRFKKNMAPITMTEAMKNKAALEA